MAFVKIYSGYTYNYYNELVTVDIYKEGFAGAVTGLTLTELKMRYTDNVEILSQSIDIGFVNTFEFSALDDLFRNYERQYKCIVYNDAGFQYFEGYMVVDVVSQSFKKNSEISLTFTDYVKRLKDIEPAIIDNLGDRKHLMEILMDCLEETGLEYPVYVNNRLYGSGNTKTAGNSLYEQTFVDVDLFWKNNIQKSNALDILKVIMKSTSSTLYIYNGAWYIERYDDIINSGDTWTQFAFSASTGTALTNKFQSYTKQDGDFNYVGQSQAIAYRSGAETLEVKLNDSNYTNLLYNNFTDDAEPFATDTVYPTPDLRKWGKSVESETYCDTDILKHPFPFTSIKYPIYMHIIDTGGWSSAYAFDTNEYFKTRGVFTKFYATVEASATTTTTLNVKWKVHPRMGFAYPDNVEYYRAYYYVKLIETASSGKYIHYNQDDEDNPYWELLATNQMGGVSNHKFNQSDLDDAGMMEINISIPLSEISSLLVGDQGFIIQWGHTLYNYSGTVYWCPNAMQGDFVASITSTLQDNNILCELNEGFIKKEEETLDLFDIENLNYKNGVYRYDLYGGLDNYWRQVKWTEDGGSTYSGLTEHYIASKYKFLNKNTLALSANILTTEKMKPFSILYDTNLVRSAANIPILLRSFSYDVVKCIYNVSTEEYSEDTITITEI